MTLHLYIISTKQTTTSHPKPLKIKKTTTYDIRNPDPVLEQEHTCIVINKITTYDIRNPDPVLGQEHTCIVINKIYCNNICKNITFIRNDKKKKIGTTKTI